MRKTLLSPSLFTLAFFAASALPAHANLATCQTAEECGIAPVQLEALTPTGGVAGIGAGDLLKLADDHDATTHEDEAVYYLDKDWRRRPFPNQAVYLSWYADFSGVKSLTKEELSQFRLGKSVVYRPGTRLVKIPSVPKVYAVEPNGSLRWIESEAVAITLYGADWNKRVDDVSEVFFTDYHEGVPLAAAIWPTGTVVRRPEDGALFVIDGLGRRELTAEALASIHLNVAQAVKALPGVVETYADLGAVPVDERRYKDTAQQDYLETLPAPHFDVPQAAIETAAGKDVTLARLRVIIGAPIIIRQLRVTLNGPLHSASAAALTDIHLTDDAGTDMFGIRQLDGSGSEESLTFSGAYTVENAGVKYVELHATVSSEIAAGATFTTLFDRASLIVADGTNGNVLAKFTPVGVFAPITATIK